VSDAIRATVRARIADAQAAQASKTLGWSTTTVQRIETAPDQQGQFDWSPFETVVWRWLSSAANDRPHDHDSV